ncbi:hypothetical protein [Pseudoalteromonas fuliginea]|uniref:Uncharacterized protein n=1 Tax=Pseudoalteromonas fuliginea TaxID=1872678 RepID=A0ABD3YAE5_9GAMM|nr:hypothetical protein [Pseudoalteromonas fuliginea]KDC51710.1 hypothetical protein DC53_07830 [Pseudoalteromonas fuliginea]
MHIEAIEQDIKKDIPHEETIRKVYLSYPHFAFIGKENLQYEIFSEVSNFFSIPIHSIQITGSGKIGQSLHKNTVFDPVESDLDIAIIDERLFIKYMEIVSNLTNGYRDATKFGRDTRTGVSLKSEYLTCISKGIFPPRIMPACEERNEINSFFGKLATKHTKYFKGINAYLYLSQSFFEKKQRTAIEAHIKNKEL